MGKRGPPPRGVFTDKSAVLSTRIRPDTRAAIQAAADASGRSLSQEIEMRLRRSLDFDVKIADAFGDRRFYALMRIVATAMSLIENPTNKGKSFLDDPYSFDQAVHTVNAVLSAFRPKDSAALRSKSFRGLGDNWYHRILADLYSMVAKYQGALEAENLLLQLREAAATPPAAVPTSPKERLPFIKVDLAGLADRIPKQGAVKEAVQELIQRSVAAIAADDSRVPAEVRAEIEQAKIKRRGK